MSENQYTIVKFKDNNLDLDITISPKEDNIWLLKKSNRYTF